MNDVPDRTVPTGVAVGYVRVSRLDEEERERKVSPEMQRAKCVETASAQRLDLIQTYQDLDISGKSTANRPGFRALMERLATGDVRYVVAYDLSRITRNMADQADFFDALRDHNALFIEASNGRTLDPRDEDQELSANVLGSVNQHQRKKTARRVRDSLAQKTAQGDLVGPVPAGYIRRKEILDSGKVARTWIEPNAETAPIVRRIFSEYATASYSLKALAQHLNELGIRPPRSPNFRNNRPPSQLFTADVLKDILSNPRYMGRVPARNGSAYPANYQALVDQETWNACERVRFQHRRVRQTARRRTSSYLVTGVLRCGRCGSTMSGQTWKSDKTHSKPRRSYTCYLRRTAGACDMPSVPQDLVEADLLDVLRTVAMPEGLAAAVDAAVAASVAGDDPKSRKKSMSALDARLERLRETYELGDISRDDYLTRRDTVNLERKTLETSKPQPVFVRQRTMLATLVDDWEFLDESDRRALVSEVFEEIRATEAGIEEFLPRERWKDYMRAVVPVEAEKVPTERKTGLFDTDAADFVLPILVRSSSDESPYPEPLAIVGAGTV